MAMGAIQPSLAQQTLLQTTTPAMSATGVNSPATRSATKRYATRNSQINISSPSSGRAIRTGQAVAQRPIESEKEVVLFRPLPFYDQICEIIAPTVLRSDGQVGKANESQIEFKLTIDMADQVAMTRDVTNIILRFCCIDPNSDEQDDNFPPDIVISVNGKNIQLPTAISNPNRPNVPAKRPGQYVDITRECKLCPFTHNNVNVKWFVDPTDLSKRYACTMIVGEKQTLDTLLDRIKRRGFTDPELTKKIIADSDNEVATTNLQCSLLCPLGKMRMTAPCKSVKCQHIPCFDASTYLQMNEKKATWICPVCYKPAYFPDLMIDGFFTEILDNAATNVTEVNLGLDGSWNPVLKMEQPQSTKGQILGPEIIIISDDDDDD